ncbi:MAG: hypothetical protein LBG94_02540 [Treponema sp.]|jgi:hypothetical protein|nr:hypothetical protein [Treponema sp.]
MPNIKWGATTAVFALVIYVLLGLLFGVRVSYIILRGLIFAAVFFGIGFGLRYVINHFLPEILTAEDDSAAQYNEQPGSHVNITLDSTGEYAVPELYKVPDDSDGMGNIDDLVSGIFNPRKAANKQKTNNKPSDQWFNNSGGEGAAAIDRMGKSGYNDTQGGDPFQETSVFESFTTKADTRAFEDVQFSPSFGDDSGLGGLPDLDMMARAFSSAGDAAPVYQAPSAASVPPAFDMSSAPSAPSMAQYFTDDSSPVEQERNTGNKAQPLEGDFSPKDIAKGISTLLSKE